MEAGIYEVKTHLAEMVERAERGESITITRRGKAVARLVPMEAAPDLARHRRAWDELMAVKEGLRARGMGASKQEILSWVKEGRR